MFSLRKNLFLSFSTGMEYNVKKQKGGMAVRERKIENILLIILLILGIPVFLAVAIYVSAFLISSFQLDLTILGEQEVTVEYGDHYADAGAEACFSGTYLLKNGKEVSVNTLSNVDESKPGTYHIRYDASFLIWSACGERIVHIVDTQKPEITLRSDPDQITLPGEPYAEEGFTARDNFDGDITDRVIRTQVGSVVTYWVSDSSGNTAEVTREIIYHDPLPPELVLLGESSVTITEGDAYQDPGFVATDNCDGDISGRVVVTGTVDTNAAGTYTIQYYVEDSYGNCASAVRTVTVNAKPQASVGSSVQQTVVPDGKVIYLTFDDGPGPYTDQLLDVLAQYDVKATFFVVDSGYSDAMQRIVREGHSIGIHSTTHEYKSIYSSEDAFFEDLEQMQSIIQNTTGVTTYLMRFPGGSSNTVSSFNPGVMTRLTAEVEARGYRSFAWTVSSGEAGETTSTDRVFENVVNGVGKRNVSIVLQHDIKSYSVAAVEKIIQWGLDNGYSFLPLDMTSPTAHHGVNN